MTQLLPSKYQTKKMIQYKDRSRNILILCQVILACQSAEHSFILFSNVSTDTLSKTEASILKDVKTTLIDTPFKLKV